MPKYDEAALEAEIKAKGLNAPRLTPELIDATIASEAFHVFPGTTMTVCALTLRNGYVVIGESAAASPANFDPVIGRRISRDNARNKIWALEGYLLRDQIATGNHPSCGAAIVKGAVLGGMAGGNPNIA